LTHVHVAVAKNKKIGSGFGSFVSCCRQFTMTNWAQGGCPTSFIGLYQGTAGLSRKGCRCCRTQQKNLYLATGVIAALAIRVTKFDVFGMIPGKRFALVTDECRTALANVVSGRLMTDASVLTRITLTV